MLGIQRRVTNSVQTVRWHLNWVLKKLTSVNLTSWVQVPGQKAGCCKGTREHGVLGKTQAIWASRSSVLGMRKMSRTWVLW